MITIISATNRPNSKTLKVAEAVLEIFKAQGAQAVELLNLEDLPADAFNPNMYSPEGQSLALGALQDKYIVPARKFFFVIPEYNGSYPGVLKFFWDACSIRKYKESFGGGKKAALLGIADGRAGNLRGIEHFAGGLHYLKIAILPNLQPLAQISKQFDANGKLNEETHKAIAAQVAQFLEF
jgi:chromate reductase, NAD(P)H dehydrogenase (quinone)